MRQASTHSCTVRVAASQTQYHVAMTTDGTTVDLSPGLREAATRLRDALVAAEEAEARAHERAESLRIALREVEALAGPAANAAAQDSQEAREAAPSDAVGIATVPASRGDVLSPRALRETGRRTATDAVRDLLRQNSRPWNATEIISALSSSGELTGLHDPPTAVRAALRRMVAKGEVVRVGRGDYRVAGPAPRPPLAHDRSPYDRPTLLALSERTVDEAKEEEP